MRISKRMSALPVLVLSALPLLGCAAHGTGATAPEAATRSGGLAFQLLTASDGAAVRALPYRAPLQSGARFALRIVAEQPAYLYVWHRGGAPGATPEALLPAPGDAAAPTLPQQPLVLPGEGQWFTLDNQPGKELFYVVAAREPLDSARLTAVVAQIPTEREPPSTTSSDRIPGPTYRVAMDQSGLCRLAFVLQHQ